ncbi:MAG: cell envelope integrity protein CreD [Candidatus Magasanikbacteria bacterium]|nr:cell envelope integrity protein CreD [Candidatus Magasanikbacteria bacterium]
MAFFNRLATAGQRWGNSRAFTLRLLVIGFLLLIFFFPTYLVQNLIRERAGRQTEAVREVSSKWGESQVVAGPILVVPYHPYGPIPIPQNPKSAGYLDPGQLRQAYFVPDQLKISGLVKTQLRSRGIYRVPLYEGDLQLAGSFTMPELAPLNLGPERMYWNKAYVVMGGLDLSGLRGPINLNWQSGASQFASGNKSKIFTSEVAAPVAFTPEPNKKYSFTISVPLRGSGNLFFVPVGKQTEVALQSNWTAPSFDGTFLPTSHQMDDKGFSAQWQVFDLNRTLPPSWTDTQQISLASAVQNASYQATALTRYYDNRYNRYSNSANKYSLGEFGVRFYLPVDIYQKTTRSAKYAMAVIGLVFLIYFLVEAAARRRVNPLQYILVGLALCIFYTLLLSISEYLSFGYAYLIASTAIVGMIGLFTKSILKSGRLGLVQGGILAFLYGFIFILLQSQDYTLLIGSIGLFLILGVLMYFSRFVNWYDEDRVEHHSAAPPADTPHF